MRDFVLLQLACILIPAVLAAVIWFFVDVIQSGEQRLGIRLKLSTLLILFPIIGGMLLVTRTIAENLTTADQINICIVSLFTIPLLWFVQLLNECWRDACEEWGVQRKAGRDADADAMLAGPEVAPREEV